MTAADMAKSALALARTLNSLIGLPGGNAYIGVAEKAIEVVDQALPILRERKDSNISKLVGVRDLLREQVRQAARNEADNLEG